MSNHFEAKVELTGVHLCCQGCVAAVEDAVANVPGAHCRCHMNDGTVTITATNAGAAQQALDAIAAAGLYGHSDNRDLVMRPVGSIPRGRVNRLRLSGIHNCCDPCADAIMRAVASVEGVTGANIEPGVPEFEVTGSFDAAALIHALNSAGFSARAEQ